MMDRCDSPFTLMPWSRRELAGSSPYARLMRVLDKIDEILFEVISDRRADPMTQFRATWSPCSFGASTRMGRR